MNADELVRLTRVRALAASGTARAIRIAAGLSLPLVAEAVGCGVSTIWRWEHGQRVPRGEPALRYGALLDDLVAAGQGGRPRKAAVP
jgi:transcriptional regulator with XRE-family HTH domain